MTPAERFLAELPLIERAIQSVVRRNHFTPSDREDFASYARLKLIEDDYRVLRVFREGSTLQTYLVTVVQNLCHDYRTQLWGKWRPSAEAKRIGALAVELERLRTREHLSFEEAVEHLQRRWPEPVSRGELEELAARLPNRVIRQRHTEELPEDVEDAGHTEATVIQAERAVIRSRAQTALVAALARLETRDRLLVQLHILRGIKMPRVATMLNAEARPLYRQMERVLKRLRQELEDAGISREAIRELLDDPDGPSA